MTPTAILKQAISEGVILSLSISGSIMASGDRGAVSRWLPVIRERKALIVEALKLDSGDAAHRGWLFHFSDHDPRECYFTPMVTHAEALAAMPEAIAAEPLATVLQSTCPPMSTKDEQVIRSWLELIGETDTEAIVDVIGKCQQDADALTYFLERAATELPKPDSQFEDSRRTCDQCANLIARRCRLAEPVQGSKVVANHGYKPNPRIKVHCAGYQAKVTGDAA